MAQGRPTADRRALSPEFSEGSGDGKLLEALLHFVAKRNAKDPFLVEERIERSHFLRGSSSEAGKMREILRKIAQPNHDVVEELRGISRLVASGPLHADAVERHIAASPYLQRHLQAQTQLTEAEGILRILDEFPVIMAKAIQGQEREAFTWRRRTEEAAKQTRLQGLRIAELEAALEQTLKESASKDDRIRETTQRVANQQRRDEILKEEVSARIGAQHKEIEQLRQHVANAFNVGTPSPIQPLHFHVADANSQIESLESALRQSDRHLEELNAEKQEMSQKLEKHRQEIDQLHIRLRRAEVRAGDVIYDYDFDDETLASG